MPLKFLNFSVPLCEGWLWLFLIRCSKLQKSFRKSQSPAQIWRVKQQNHSFLANWINWTLSSHYLLWLLGSLKNKSLPWFHFSLWSVFGLLRIQSLSHSTLLSLFHLCLTLSKTQLQKAFSLYAGALSLWPTQNLNRYMAWCGCHEILIPCSTTVLFSTPFLLISISRVEGEGEFISEV